MKPSSEGTVFENFSELEEAKGILPMVNNTQNRMSRHPEF
jgi:hypothetical protein